MGNENSSEKYYRKEDVEKALRNQEIKNERKIQELLAVQKKNLEKQKKCELEKAVEALEKEVYQKKYKELERREMWTAHQISSNMGPTPFASVSEAHQRTCPIYPNLQNEFPSTSNAYFGNPVLISSSDTLLPSAPIHLQQSPTNKNIKVDALRDGIYKNQKHEKQRCPNADDGCTLSFYSRDLAAHTKECLFKEKLCPLNVSNGCNWRGKLNHMKDHFEEYHQEHCVADVDKEMKLLIIEQSYIIYFVELGPFKFLVHIRVDAQRLIQMTAQMIGTMVSAAKWTYEFHVYNKLTPKRKYQHNDVCQNDSRSAMELFDNYECATITANHAKSFASNSHLTFKFYLKKTNKWSKQDPK